MLILNNVALALLGCKIFYLKNRLHCSTGKWVAFVELFSNGGVIKCLLLKVRETSFLLFNHNHAGHLNLKRLFVLDKCPVLAMRDSACSFYRLVH